MGDMLGGPVNAGLATIIPQEAPTPKPPAPIPSADPNDPAIRAAKRKAQADVMGRAGRTSTILTAPDQRGGSGNAFDTYASKTLGVG